MSRAMPGPERIVSALTAPCSRKRRAKISISSGDFGPNEMWPPSLDTTNQTTVGRHQRSNTEAGAGPEHRLDARARFVLRPEQTHVRRREPRQRPGDRLEIIDHAQLRESETLRQLAATEPPRAVGQCHLVATIQGTRDRQHRRARLHAGSAEIGVDRSFEGLHGVVFDDDDVLGPPRRAGERKAAVGATNVGQQDRVCGLLIHGVQAIRRGRHRKA